MRLNSLFWPCFEFGYNRAWFAFMCLGELIRRNERYIF